MSERRAYRPSNGTEGIGFYENWCGLCVADIPFREGDCENGCRILANTLVYDLDDPEYPDEWVYDADGNPCCTAFREEAGKEE